MDTLPERETDKLGPGRMVLVVGPSGAGKDTLMNALREALGDDDGYVFAQRRITRPADGETETHVPITEADFERAVESGTCSLAWRAHGLGYVLAPELDEAIRDGKTVIANGSRGALSGAFDKYAHAIVLLITAPKDVLAQRLAARGRESRVEIERRLERADIDMPGTPNLVRIENTGTVESGVARILEALNKGAD